MSYQCGVCFGPTSLKGGGLCFTCAMERGGQSISELWCPHCQGPSSEAKVFTLPIPPTKENPNADAPLATPT